MDVLLIGVSHGYQYEGNKSIDTSAFNELLEKIHESHNVDLLAEELNREAINSTKIQGAAGSVAESVSLRSGIAHKFCDPTKKERMLLGIPERVNILNKLGFNNLPCLTPKQNEEVENEQREYWDVRERFWLEKLVETQKKNIVFILGARHVQRFRELLEGNGYNVKVLFEHWQP